MAQLFSGENNKLLNDDNSINWFKYLIDTKKVEAYGLNVLNDAISFYKDKFNIGKSL